MGGTQKPGAGTANNPKVEVWDPAQPSVRGGRGGRQHDMCCLTARAACSSRLTKPKTGVTCVLLQYTTFWYVDPDYLKQAKNLL
jgi:hypothetical protein